MATKDEMAKFAKEIHDLVSKTDYNYIEAIAAHCKETGLEIEVAATLCNANLKSRIGETTMPLNLDFNLILNVAVAVVAVDWLGKLTGWW